MKLSNIFKFNKNTAQKSFDKSNGKSLEEEQIKAQGGYVSVRNYSEQSIYAGLDAKRLGEILFELKQGQSKDFLILAEEFEKKRFTLYFYAFG